MTPGTALDVTLRSPGGAPLMQVTGNLELSGKLTVTAGTGFGAGLYPLFHYQGGLSGSGLSAGSLPGGYTYSLVVSNAGQVVLAVSKSEVPPSPVTLVLPTIGTDGMEFSFLAESGRSYSVEYNPVLSPTGWTFLRRITGAGAVVKVVDPDKSAPQKFYRILSE